jgi:Fe-S metabolism associated domain
MSRGLTYADLTAAEQVQYTTIVSRIQAASTGGDDGSNALPPHASTSDATAVHTPAPPPLGPRHVWAAVQRVSAYGQRWVARLRRQTRAPTDATQLAHFIRIQAARRGFATFERASFPHFPAGIDPFPPRVTDERATAAHAYPDALHHILVTFREASPTQRLALLVAYAETLPELPAALQQARDTMEQVDECQVPVFLSAQLHEGRVPSCCG